VIGKMRRRRRPSLRPATGMSLIEVMVATVVFLIAVLGVFAHLTYGRVMLNIEVHRRSAAQIAHSRLENLRAVAYADLPAYAESDTVVSFDGLEALRDTVVEDVDEDEDDAKDYRRVIVTVTWTENGTDHEVELVTIRSAYR